ncbi:MAG: phage portal protein [Planctomycetota bacterium]
MGSVGGRSDGEAAGRAAEARQRSAGGPGAAAGLDPALVDLLIRRQADENEELERWHSYYRNPARRVGTINAAGTSQTTRRLAQEAGLPARVTGVRREGLGDDRSFGRREVVIENDIAWRVQVMIDFLFGKMPLLVSAAEDERTREVVEALLDAAWDASGGLETLQDAALMAHVFGHVDFVVRVDEVALRVAGRRASRARLGGGDGAASRDVLLEIAAEAGRAFRIEAVDPRRSVPVLDADDYRVLDGYVIHYERESNGVERVGLRRGVFGGESWGRRLKREAYTEVFGPNGHEVWVGGELVAKEDGGVFDGIVPVVHVQNQSQPLVYAGVGEVEPLIPLQDELNTRLSDRANRVTMQSFNMYLAKGIEGFDSAPVAPGTVWSTDNPDASVERFGGDASSPSEDKHIEQVRSALDKISGVPPVASGVVEARIGNLTSANALRVTMVGLLAKTNRKRVTYGRGIRGVCGLVLEAASRVGLLELSAKDREVRLEWPDPLPIDEQELATAVRVRQQLGVPTERVAESLGFVSDGGLGETQAESVEVSDAGA